MKTIRNSVGMILFLLVSAGADAAESKLTEWIDLVTQRFDRVEAELNSLKREQSITALDETRLASIESSLHRIEHEHRKAIADSIGGSAKRLSSLEKESQSLAAKLDALQKQLPLRGANAGSRVASKTQYIIVQGSNCDIVLEPSVVDALAGVQILRGENGNYSIDVHPTARVTLFVNGSNNDVNARRLQKGNRVTVQMLGSNNDVSARRGTVKVYLDGTNNDVKYRR